MTLDLLLVHPVFLGLNPSERELNSPYFPLGLLYLAAFVRESGFGVEIFDGTFKSGPEEFVHTLEVLKPRVVGIGVVQPNREMANNLARLANQHGATVIMGGPDPTRYPESYLQEPWVDFVVHHEGEITTVELLECLLKYNGEANELDKIEGIAYRSKNGQICVNPRRSYILNLDDLPLPARDMIDMEEYLGFWREQNGYASMTISIARGCPFGCEWCQDSVHGAKLRQRSPQSVVAEVKYIMQHYNIDRLRVVDDVDGIDRKWLEDWEACAKKEAAILPFEALNDLQRKDIPMLDVRDSL